MITRRRAALAAGVFTSVLAFGAHESHALAQEATVEAPPPPAQYAPFPTVEHDENHDEFGRKKHGLALSFGGQAGITYFTEETPFGTAKGIGRALEPGPNLGLRASLEITPWFAIDARGLLMNNEGNDVVGLGSLTTVGGFGALRFTLPLPRVRPYVFGGFGGYSILAAGTSTQLVNGTFSAIEMGIGVLIPMSHHVDIGVEYSYSHLNSEVLSSNENADGGDPSSWSLFAQYRFSL